MKSFNIPKILSYTFCLFLLMYFVMLPEKASCATIESILLWANKVLPNVFIFGFISKIVINMSESKSIKPIKKILKSLTISDNASNAYLISLVCASPLSIKCVCEMYEENKISSDDAQHLITLCSAVSPLFLYSTMGILMYQKRIYAISLLIVNYIGSYITSYIYKLIYKKNYNPSTPLPITQSEISFFNLFTSAITNSASTAINIGAFVVFFSVVIKSLSDFNIFNENSLLFGILSIFTEITSGAAVLKNHLQKNELLVMAVSYASVGFGGICFLMQNLSFITKTNLSVKRFVLFKLINSVVNAVLGCIILLIFNFIKYPI